MTRFAPLQRVTENPDYFTLGSTDWENKSGRGRCFATLLEPDMPPERVRSEQTKWGQKAKRNKGGRPIKKKTGYKKQQRLQKLDRVIRLYREGKKLSDISFRTGIKRSTIRDWINKYGG